MLVNDVEALSSSEAGDRIPLCIKAKSTASLLAGGYPQVTDSPLCIFVYPLFGRIAFILYFLCCVRNMARVCSLFVLDSRSAPAGLAMPVAWPLARLFGSPPSWPLPAGRSGVLG